MVKITLFMILSFAFIIILTAYRITKFYNSAISIAARDKLMRQCEKLLKQILLTISIILILFSIVFILI